MQVAVGLAGIALVIITLIDAFETVILPRGLTRAVRLSPNFYRSAWAAWVWIARRSKIVNRREALLSYFGPLSLLMLLALWGLCLICGFALIHWGMVGENPSFLTDLYVSGTTFFTLGLGDVTPHTRTSRGLTVAEAGIGFGFLAIVIGYLPVLYQAFSRREVAISLLDARAGSPPTAVELLRRQCVSDGGAALNQLLRDWEQWSAELLENHISYPVLCYYRSQHDRQSWIAAMTAILDACALVMVGIEGVPPLQSELTFAIARHAVVDLAAIFGAAPAEDRPDRLPPGEFDRIRKTLSDSGIRLADGSGAEVKLTQLRDLYEPFVCSLANRMAFEMPPFIRTSSLQDAWQTTAWHHANHD